MTTSPPLNPDAPVAWKRDCAAAHVRIAELERQATAPGGLNAEELAEHRRLRAFAGMTLGAWLGMEGRG